MNSTNNATIYSDLDGTIADLYGFNDWLEYLQNEQTTPYEEAGLLIDDELQRWNVEKLVDANNFRNILNMENLWSCLFSLASE